jgi:hypothetical protein
MKGKLKFLLSRIPWRVLIAIFGIVLVINGGSKLLSVELPVTSDTAMQVAKQGMGMVVAGGVTLIAAITIR